MKIIQNKTIDLKYDSIVYKFHITKIETTRSGYDITMIMTNTFRKAFKKNEGLARWSHHRFQKFVIESLRVDSV